MLSTRKISLLATVIALAAVPTAALAQPLNPGPVSILVNCSEQGEIFALGQTQTFQLTDITIANKGSTATVFITNPGFSGVAYVVPAGSSQTQKFETPIQFKGSSDSPEFSCDTTNPNVFIAIQGALTNP